MKKRIFAMFLIAASFVILFMIYAHESDLQADLEVMDEIRKEVVIESTDTDFVAHDKPSKDDTDSDPDIDPNLLRRIDFKKLQGINPATKRWVFIPNTNIDNYVMQEQNVGEYFYLWRDIYGRGNGVGSYLSPPEYEDLPDAHLLIFGHRMNNGSMFGNLPGYYNSVSSAYNYPCVYIYYPDHSERWRIWVAIDAEPSDDVYFTPYTLGSGDYQNMLDHVVDISRYHFDEDVNKWTPTCYLSTCNQWLNGDWNRFLAGYVFECKYFYDEKKLTGIEEYLSERGDTYGREDETISVEDAA